MGECARAWGCASVHFNKRGSRIASTAFVGLTKDPNTWTGGGGFWEVGVPEVSERSEVRAAHGELPVGKQQQWLDRP